MRAGLAAKPKDIRDYYAALNAYAEQGVTHEGAGRSAFQNLLAETGRRAGWTLIPELSLGSIRPDGTFRDEYFLNRGYWEAKDTRDRLETEIEKKRTYSAIGSAIAALWSGPLANIASRRTNAAASAPIPTVLTTRSTSSGSSAKSSVSAWKR